MTTAFPAALDNFPNPTGSTSQAASPTLSERISNLNDAVEAIQANIGVRGNGAMIRPEHYGADPTGVALSDTAFASCAALGKLITLTAGATYYLSTRVNGVNGTRFVCDGMCKVKIKTGTGGYNSVVIGDKDTQTVFYFGSVDDIGLEGIEFQTDGVAEKVTNPIRVIGGCTIRGCDFNRLRFKGLPMVSGGMLSLNTIGNGSYRVRDIAAFDCGTALGNTYWAGSVQITVFEIDNDMVGGVASYPGYASNIRAQNVLLTGTALANYGQQTDCVNIAGVTGTDRKGPTIHGVYADGIGEGIDLFCGGATITGVRLKDCYGYGVKFVHGAQGNVVECDVIESFGLAAVGFFGSSQVGTNNTKDNICRVGVVRGGGDYGPLTADVPVVLFGDNGGTGATCLPKNNYCSVDRVVVGANLDFIVKGDTAGTTNNNRVVIGQSGDPTLAFVYPSSPVGHRVKYMERKIVNLTMAANQVLTTAVDTVLNFNTVASDDNNQYLATNKIRIKHPGLWRFKASIRVQLAAGDDVELSILRNGSAIATACKEPVGNTLAYTYEVDKTMYVDESTIGLASSDFTVSAKITSGGAISVQNTAYMTYFEAVPVN